MRHLKAGRTLSRNSSHRLAMFRNMSISLFEHGKIKTTVPKAKELRGFVERLITLGKDGSLHARRRALAILPNKEAVRVLFQDIAPQYADRPGGYTRVIKLSKVRLGDAGATAMIELVGASDFAAATVEPTIPSVED